MKDKAFIHLYTGNGKGKTTAALGLAIRAAGAGMKVYFAQFVKGMPYSELHALEFFPLITIKQFGRDCFIKNEPSPEDVIAARRGLSAVQKIISDKACDMLVLDEVCIALHYKLFELDELIEMLREKPPSMEVVLTGRYAPEALYDLADLITEMKEIKHYYQQGIPARKGIEY